MARSLMSWIAPPPPAPPHVETYTIDPPKPKTAPITTITRTITLPGRIKTVATSVAFTVPDDPDPVDEPNTDVAPELLPPVLSILVDSNAARADLVADQRLPARFAVRDRTGVELAQFNGCELAVRFARLTGPHLVVRLDDGELMTAIVPHKRRL